MSSLQVISNPATGGDDPELALYFSRPDASALIKRRRGVEISEKTLANWSWAGKGPRWRRLGRRSVAQGRDILAAVDRMLSDDTPPQAA
jgi:hypothetical protein